MAKEQTLNDPLCGAEIKTIIIQKVADALERDCTLTDDVCYPGFSFSFDAKISYLRSPNEGTLVWGGEKKGDKVPDSAPVETILAEYETDSPNKAREENELPIPVLIQTPAGPKREKVRFAKPKSFTDAKKKAVKSADRQK